MNINKIAVMETSLGFSLMLMYFSWPKGAPVVQWVKRWPTDLVVPGLRPARGEIFSTLNRVPLHTAFHYHPPIVLK